MSSPAEARLEVDLRAVTRADLDEAEAEVRRIAASTTVPDVTCVVEQSAKAWPMEKSAGTAALVDAAVSLAGRLGFDLKDAATGGASDANTTAGLGVPTVDGLGPIGGGDHSKTSTSNSSRSCRARPCWPRSCSAPAASRRRAADY